MSQNIIILIGPPGGGKGSLSKLCIENLGWIQFSTGNLCREHIAKQTDIGKKIDLIIKSGKLISDSLIIDMVDEWLTNNLVSENSIIFDGYPRTLVQVKALNDLVNNKFNKTKVFIIRLLANEQTIVKRIFSRLVCSNNKCQMVYTSNAEYSLSPKKMNVCDKCGHLLVQRNDDEEKAILERLSVYKKHEKEMLDYYSQIGQSVFELDAEQPIENVFVGFKNLIN